MAEKLPKSNIYTKTGDTGTSSLYNGERRFKTDIIFEVLGHQDELCASIGIAREYCKLTNNGLNDMLIEIQSRLFDIGACVATPKNNSDEDKIQYVKFNEKHTQQLEKWIDLLDHELPPLRNFIIPSGGLSSTHLNLSRTICRRCERNIFHLIESNQVDLEVGKYLNRLSDFLFVASRIATQREGQEEVIWRKEHFENDETEIEPTNS
mmetsp:Transcript_20757/g.21410  ORF Transcript_20757/g.21410 Transcript_20757/m.21410 type:complete len:208 (+) Transcript_20757:2-625(+)